MNSTPSGSVAIILSGGSGKRLGSDIPKQYLKVQGMSLLQYTLTAFEQSDVDEILVVAAPEYLKLCEKLARECGCGKLIQVIPGGKERYDSVRNGLQFLAGRLQMPGVSRIVLIHDGARPFIRPETINEIQRQVAEYGAAIAAAPCTDTIKIADAEGFISATTDRSLTWAAQTPQAFWLPEIYQAYEEIIGNGKTDGITDDAMVYQMAFPEKPVKLVDAGPENVKITTKEDLLRAEAVLTNRKHGDSVF